MVPGKVKFRKQIMLLFAGIALSPLTRALGGVSDQATKIKLDWSVAGEEETACLPSSPTDFRRPMVVGLGKNLFRNTWQLHLRLENRDLRNPVETIFVDALEKETGKMSSFSSTASHSPHGSRALQQFSYSIPLEGSVPKVGDFREFSLAVRVFQKNGRRSEFVNSVYVLSNKDSLRIYDFNRSCLKSMPPMVISEGIKAPQGGIYPQDYVHEELLERIEGKMVTDMSRYLSVGYYVPGGTDVAVTNGTPTVAYNFYPADQRMELRRRQVKAQVTFRFYQDEIGYLVSKPAKKYSPYQVLRFDTCGRLQRVSKSWVWDEQVVSAFALVVLPAAQEGRFDVIEEKLKQYPTYNTCQKGDL